jgi:hypothetical protein
VLFARRPRFVCLLSQLSCFFLSTCVGPVVCLGALTKRGIQGGVLALFIYSQIGQTWTSNELRN